MEDADIGDITAQNWLSPPNEGYHWLELLGAEGVLNTTNWYDNPYGNRRSTYDAWARRERDYDDAYDRWIMNTYPEARGDY